jgi:hypothetical protein
MNTKDKLYWYGVGERFDKVNTVLKWTLIPTSIVIVLVFLYFN